MPDEVTSTTASDAAPDASSIGRSPRRAGAAQRGWRAIMPLAAPVCAVAGLAIFAPSYSLASTIVIYAIAALGCNLLLGYTGLLSFGQGIFFGVGAFAAGLAFVHWDVQAPAGLLIATLAGAGVATAVGSLCILRRDVHFVMLTFAFASMFAYAVYLFKDVTGGENGLRGFPAMTLGAFGSTWLELDTGAVMFAVASVTFVAAYWALTRLTRSAFGATLMAIRENEDRAIAIGYPTMLFKLLAFTVSGLVSGIAGGLYAVYLGSVPDSALQLETSTMILVMTILGGTGSLFGSFLGSLAYLLLSHYLAPTWDRWQILLAAALLAVVLALRGGLWGGLRGALAASAALVRGRVR
ncbi:branched-chain amino acid ABC transporter permease [Actinomadura sp. KC216]|uniref:branched-chain amino acid ABC transporter permease n=1 Tax=Actinomadura sp. KC216 TaxID=2530370 RepID=UPI00104DD7D2|nr:branched-chain amino acid ABC transporter permease [Actinomadura sp. KC216]TDB77360.1 branched-chain amino acid ABC transporter permease [Actinomadura sp. KC216]